MSDLVIFFDLDDTLLDSGCVRALLNGRLGAASEAFWAGYQEVHAELGYADVVAALERLDTAEGPSDLDALVDGLDFGACLLPGAREALTRAAGLGVAVIVTDGEERFQQMKAASAGLDRTVEGRVHVFAHKEEHLRELIARYPGTHHVLVDDRPSILAAAKADLGAALTTVRVRQGRYATENDEPPADATLDAIAGFASLDVGALSVAAPH